MTYSLPFGLTQKPVNHYMEHGVVKFNVREGVLYFYIKNITKSANGVVMHGVVKSKEHLNKLLALKSISEIQTIEEVVS